MTSLDCHNLLSVCVCVHLQEKGLLTVVKRIQELRLWKPKLVDFHPSLRLGEMKNILGDNIYMTFNFRSIEY